VSHRLSSLARTVARWYWTLPNVSRLADASLVCLTRQLDCRADAITDSASVISAGADLWIGLRVDRVCGSGPSTVPREGAGDWARESICCTGYGWRSSGANDRPYGGRRRSAGGAGCAGTFVAVLRLAAGPGRDLSA